MHDLTPPLVNIYCQDCRTNFDAQYIKQCRCAFWGSQNYNFTLRPPYSPKTIIFGPDFDGT